MEEIVYKHNADDVVEFIKRHKRPEDKMLTASVGLLTNSLIVTFQNRAPAYIEFRDKLIQDTERGFKIQSWEGFFVAEHHCC